MISGTLKHLSLSQKRTKVHQTVKKICLRSLPLCATPSAIINRSTQNPSEVYLVDLTPRKAFLGFCCPTLKQLINLISVSWMSVLLSASPLLQYLLTSYFYINTHVEFCPAFVVVHNKTLARNTFGLPKHTASFTRTIPQISFPELKLSQEPCFWTGRNWLAKSSFSVTLGKDKEN